MLKERIFVFLALTAIGFIAYRDCLGIFIPSDSFSQLFTFKNGMIADIQDKNNTIPYFVSALLLFLLFKLFGIVSAYWISTAVFLHSLNAFFVFIVTRSFTKHLSFPRGKIISFFAALLFLISPYQTEAVLWSPTCLPMLFATAFFLLCLYFYISFLALGKWPALFLLHALFLLAVFSYESTFILPLVATILLGLYRKTSITVLSVRSFWLTIITPQALILFAYLFMSKLLFGEWFWHAGSINVSIPYYQAAGTILKYIAKFFFFYRYLPAGPADEVLRNIFGHPLYIIIICLLFCFCAFVIFRSLLSKNKQNGQLLLVLFLCFFVSLIPVLPLDSSFLKYIYPDRYGYLPSVFFYIFISLSALILLKRTAMPFLAIYTVVCYILLLQTIPVWNAVNEYCGKLIKNYKPFTTYDNVYILNLPAYYKGIAAFRCAFPEAIYFTHPGSRIENIHVIAGSYEETEADSLVSIQISGSTINVQGPKKTTPHFSTTGGWAQSYQTNEYSVTLNSAKNSYLLSFKQGIPPNSALLYIANGNWKKVN